MSLDKTCPQCGAILPKELQDELCPRCLIQYGLQGDDSLPSMADIEMTWKDAESSGKGVEATLKMTATLPIGGHFNDRLNVRPLELGSPHQGTNLPRYELLEKLGEGGMGVVHAARQVSLDRRVAVKMVKANVPSQLGAKFLSEAAVTGDLDHPNIVPLHDLGSGSRGEPAYVMKAVTGREWKDSLTTRSRAENIDILLRVADAVAFAHAHGTIHRDIKPGNVMLGEFGEVFLMDWGLAASIHPDSKAAPLAAREASGSPAYMAPEMAMGEGDKIGPHSDIYLLGATLYELITGSPPHPGDDVLSCVFNASRNQIRPTREEGELVNIALRAMAASPKDRYPSVVAFQEALRCYQVHAESVAAAKDASEQLTRARQDGDYVLYARAMYGFEQAHELWQDNTDASKSARVARMEYAKTALQRGDLDLASELLQAGGQQHDSLAAKVNAAIRKRQARTRRLQRLHRMAAILVLSLITALTIGAWRLNAERLSTEAQRQQAETLLSNTKASEKKALSYTDSIRAVGTRAADAFVKVAHALVDERKFDEAHRKVKIALELAPDSADARILLAQLLIANRKFDQGTEQLAHCLNTPHDGLARALLDACHITDPTESIHRDVAVQAIFTQQEMLTLAERLAIDDAARDQLALAHFKSSLPHLAKYLGVNDTRLLLTSGGINDLTPFQKLPIRYLAVDGNPIDDLSPLRGMRLARLSFTNTNVTDLRPLSEMALEHLSFSGCRRLSDLSPLRGMPLVYLNASFTDVGDLSPIAGMHLEQLNLQGTYVSDLSALREMPLTALSLNQCYSVRDLSVLAGMPLTSLGLDNVRAEDFSVLATLPLKFLSLSATQVSNVSMLHGRPLKVLNIQHTTIADIGPLKGMALKTFKAYKTKLQDLSPLAGMPIQHLYVGNSQVTNITPLKGMPLVALDIRGCVVPDLTPLAGMQLEYLAFSADHVKKGLELVRDMHSLRQIHDSEMPKATTPEAFWHTFDARQGDKQEGMQP